jgi:hypothetical protein
MLHACLYTICFVFCYTLWHFYVFSRTNPLMRCHSVSSLFLMFLCFRKATQEILSELDETKAKIPIFPKRHGVQSRDGGVPEGGRTTPWRGPPPSRTGVWCGPLAHTLTPPFRLYIPPRWENLKPPINFHETYCKSPLSLSWDREGPEALPGTLPERGITAKGLLHHHACLQSDA